MKTEKCEDKLWETVGGHYGLTGRNSKMFSHCERVCVVKIVMNWVIGYIYTIVEGLG